jgi:hypothetical protein
MAGSALGGRERIGHVAAATGDWLAAAPQDFTIAEALRIIAVPARHFWDPAFLRKVPGVVLSDDRPGAPIPADGDRGGGL